MISKIINYIATNSMDIEGMNINKSGSVICYSSWLNNMRLKEIGSHSIYKILSGFMDFKI
jgi:hypothetical protein